MCLRPEQFADLYRYQKIMELLPLQTHLVFSNYGSEVHIFWVIPTYFCYFWFRTPCSNLVCTWIKGPWSILSHIFSFFLTIIREYQIKVWPINHTQNSISIIWGNTKYKTYMRQVLLLQKIQGTQKSKKIKFKHDQDDNFRLSLKVETFIKFISTPEKVTFLFLGPCITLFWNHLPFSIFLLLLDF